jgi:hypothetical protein
MATKSMAYDHPAYLVPVTFGGEIAATASSKSARFACYTAMAVKSFNVTVLTAGTAVNAINLVRMAAGGTALTTMASIASTVGTNVGGVTINALATHASASALAQGDALWAEKGSGDATGVYAVGVECVLVPGANVTA